MKSPFFLSVFFIALVFTTSSYSQNIYADAEPNSTDSDALIHVSIKNTDMNKIVVIDDKNPSNTAVKEITKDVAADRKVLNIKVKLLAVENSFSVIGYKDNELIQIINKSITIRFTGNPSSLTYKLQGEDQSRTSPPQPPKTGNGDGDSETKNESKKLSIADFDNVTKDNPKEWDDSEIKLKVVPPTEISSAKKYTVTSRNQKSSTAQTFEESIQKNADKAVPQDIDVDLKQGLNEVTISTKIDTKDKAGKDVSQEYKAVAYIYCNDPCGGAFRSVNTRTVVGFEQVGASSANSKTFPFLDFFINVPLTNNRNTFSLWTDFRFSAATVQSFAALSNVSNNLLNPIFANNDSVNNIVQSFRVTGGVDFRVIPERNFLSSLLIPGKSSVSLIAGGGITSPLTSSQQTAQIFKIPKIANNEVNPEFIKLFPGIDFTGKTNIAFVVPERDRFFRRWFVGTRIQHTFYRNNDTALDLSPAMLDITFGQDEAITKILKNKVMSFDGFLPFPITKLNYIYFYGGASLQLTRKINSNVPRFFLQPAETIDLTDSNNTVIVSADSNPLTLSNRDTFRFGIGVDIFKLIRRGSDTPR